jgi:hypothetical protein
MEDVAMAKLVNRPDDPDRRLLCVVVVVRD